MLHSWLVGICVLLFIPSQAFPGLRSRLRRRGLGLPNFQPPKMPTKPDSQEAADWKVNAIPLKSIPAQVLMDIHLGVPPQPFTVVVDTGSSTLVIPDVSCPVDICVSSRRYNSSRSKTAVTVPCNDRCTCVDDRCHMHIRYGDGSGGSGHLQVDTLVVGGYDVPNVSFASLSTQTLKGGSALFREDMEGVMGLGYWSLNCLTDGGTFCLPTAWDHFIQHRNLPNKFAIWVGDEGGSGTLDIGHTDPTQFHSHTIVWARIQRQRFYTLRMTALAAGPSAADSDESVSYLVNDTAEAFGDAIVDTGTTLLLLKRPAYEILRDYFQDEYCGGSAPRLKYICTWAKAHVWDRQDISFWLLKEEEIHQYPTLYFYLDGPSDSTTAVAIPPAVYWSCVAFRDLRRCYFGIQSSPNDGTILGDVFLRRYYVIFDREAALVGFGGAKKYPPPPSPPPAPSPPLDSPALCGPTCMAVAAGLGTGLLLTIYSTFVWWSRVPWGRSEQTPVRCTWAAAEHMTETQPLMQHMRQPLHF